jgi:PAT family beta-lactamase induction signal transducer AmpG
MAADAPAMPAPWRDRRFPVLLALGFSAGVPLPLVAGLVLRQWFSEAGVSLAEIGLTALIGLSYSLKFLWSPALDALPPPLFRGLGRRRGWLLTVQPLLALGILAMGMTDPATDPLRTSALAALVAFLSASQDIVVDAWRIEALAEREQGIGLAFYVWGYRGALLASGAGTLWMVGGVGWSGAYAYAAGLIVVGIAAALLAPEPTPPARPPAGWRARLTSAVAHPFLDFMRRRHWLAILLFVALFKLGEALAGVMTAPFYRSLGFSRETVAGVASVFGLFATLGGALAGGWLVARIGTARALVLTGLGQMLSNLMYVALAAAGHSLPVLWAQGGRGKFHGRLGRRRLHHLPLGAHLPRLHRDAVRAALLASRRAAADLGRRFGLARGSAGLAGLFPADDGGGAAMALMLWLLGRLPPEETRIA